METTVDKGKRQRTDGTKCPSPMLSTNHDTSYSAYTLFTTGVGLYVAIVLLSTLTATSRPICAQVGSGHHTLSNISLRCRNAAVAPRPETVKHDNSAGDKVCQILVRLDDYSWQQHGETSRRTVPPSMAGIVPKTLSISNTGETRCSPSPPCVFAKPSVDFAGVHSIHEACTDSCIYRKIVALYLSRRGWYMRRRLTLYP